MSILEYALDVNKDVSEIINLCQSLKINKNKEDDFLTEEEIILLDNELDSLKENENPDYEIDEELESKVADEVKRCENLIKTHKDELENQRVESKQQLDNFTQQLENKVEKSIKEIETQPIREFIDRFQEF